MKEIFILSRTKYSAHQLNLFCVSCTLHTLDYSLLLNLLQSVYTLVSSTSFGDSMCLVGHTFIHGTHSIMVRGQLCYFFMIHLYKHCFLPLLLAM